MAFDREPLKCSNAIEFSVTHIGQPQIRTPQPICVQAFSFELRPHVVLGAFLVSCCVASFVPTIEADIIKDTGVHKASSSRESLGAVDGGKEIDSFLDTRPQN